MSFFNVWLWLNEHISKEGVIKKMEALYDKGFGDVCISKEIDVLWKS